MPVPRTRIVPVVQGNAQLLLICAGTMPIGTPVTMLMTADGPPLPVSMYAG